MTLWELGSAERRWISLSETAFNFFIYILNPLPLFFPLFFLLLLIVRERVEIIDNFYVLIEGSLVERSLPILVRVGRVCPYFN
jgi:hypothetical protein